jgi:hypothetical protein
MHKTNYQRRFLEMKKLSSLFFAVALMFSVVFISEAISSNSPFSAQAQVTVKRKNRSIASRTYRGGKYVGRKTVQGAKYVGRKTYQGGKYVGTKGYQGGKYVTKKTVKGTKYVGKKTVKGTKSVFSKTKKVVVGN